MTLKAIIQPAGKNEWVGSYPVFYAVNDGVKVGPAGELMLVADRDEDNNPKEFRIYAPGTWKEVNVEYIEDGEE